MIKSIYIKNFKVFKEETFILDKNNILIGDNNTGKTTLLLALDAFFNKNILLKKDFNNINVDIEIGILTNNQEYLTKVYSKDDGNLKEYIGNTDILDQYSYIYVNSINYKDNELISKFMIAHMKSKMPEELTDTLKAYLQNSMGTIIDVVLEQTKNNQDINIDYSVEIDKALKIDFIDIENHLQINKKKRNIKRVLYALLTNIKYDNLIIGLDEIEKLILVEINKGLLNIIKNNFLQTLIATHSNKVVSSVEDYEILPIYGGNVSTITKLYKSFSNKDNNPTYILVEGKTDINWVKKVINLSGIMDHFIIIPCGGHTNIEAVQKELEASNLSCKVIKDGDSKDYKHSLNKECIELYIPLNAYNKLFNKNASIVPNTKEEFFSSIRKENISIDSAKKIISDNVDNFLKINNPLVDEILNLIL